MTVGAAPYDVIFYVFVNSGNMLL